MEPPHILLLCEWGLQETAHSSRVSSANLECRQLNDPIFSQQPGKEGTHFFFLNSQPRRLPFPRTAAGTPGFSPGTHRWKGRQEVEFKRGSEEVRGQEKVRPGSGGFPQVCRLGRLGCGLEVGGWGSGGWGDVGFGRLTVWTFYNFVFRQRRQYPFPSFSILRTSSNSKPRLWPKRLGHLSRLFFGSKWPKK